MSDSSYSGAQQEPADVTADSGALAQRVATSLSLDTFRAESGDMFVGEAGDIARYSYASSSFASKTVEAYSTTNRGPSIERSAKIQPSAEININTPLQQGILEGIWGVGAGLISDRLHGNKTDIAHEKLQSPGARVMF